MHCIKDSEVKLPADSSITEATEDKEQVTNRQTITSYMLISIKSMPMMCGIEPTSLVLSYRISI